MGVRKEKEGGEGKEEEKEKKRKKKKERKRRNENENENRSMEEKRREEKRQKHVQYRSIILLKIYFVFVVTLYNSSAKQLLIKVMCIYNRSLLLR